MTLNKVQKTGNKVEFEIAQSKEEFLQALEQSYKKNVNKIFVQGFRKGRAPRKVIEKIYGEGVFYEDAVNIAYPKLYDDAIKEQNLKPVSKPVIDIVEIGQDTGLIIKVEVTVKPDVKIGEYKGLKIDRPKYEVTDAEVAGELMNMAVKNARIISVDRPAQNGDIAVIDFEGFIDDKAFEGGKGEDYSLELGSGTFIPGFEEQVEGKSKGDEFDVNVMFPNEYHEKTYAGKSAVFKVKLKEVKKSELPAIDDEFAKEISEHDTIEEVKAKIKDTLADAKVKRADDDVENSIMDKLAALVEADIPQCMFDDAAADIENERAQRLSMQGITMEQFYAMTNTTKEKFNEMAYEQAQQRTKVRLALEKIAELENITITDEETNQELKKLSEMYKMPVDKIKELIPIENLKEDLATKKAVDLVRDASVITEVEVSKPDDKADDKPDDKADDKAEDKKPKAKKTAKKADKKADDALSDQKDKDKEQKKAEDTENKEKE